MKCLCKAYWQDGVCLCKRHSKGTAKFKDKRRAKK